MINLQVFNMLVRREYWEHQAFLRVPVILSCVILFVFIVGMFTARNFLWNHVSGGIYIDDASFHDVLQQSDMYDLRKLVWMTLFNGVMLPMAVALCFTVFFYSLNSLYDERRDRSILFWKSMPVSDASTVLSKVFSAFITAPAMVFIITVLTQLAVLILVTLWELHNGGYVWKVIWSPLLLFKVFYYDFILLFTGILWISPVLGWLWFISSLVKRAPFLIAVFVPLGWVLVELMLLHTRYLLTLIIERWSGLWQLVGSAINDHSVSALLQDGSFWWGLLICAVFIMAAIYIRRYKDDSY